MGTAVSPAGDNYDVDMQLGKMSYTPRICHGWRQSKWQATVDIDPRVYLRTKQIRAWTPLLLIDTPTHSSPALFSRSHYYFPAETSLLVQEGWIESHIGSWHAAAHNQQSQVLLDKVLRHCPSFASTQLSDFWDLPSHLRPPTPGCSSRIFTFFFQRQPLPKSKESTCRSTIHNQPPNW